MDCFEILNIDETKDTKEIRKAYSKLLTQYSPETDPEGFQRLREAYEEAISRANESEESKQILSPIDEFMKDFEDNYRSFDKRLSVECWRELLERDICYNIDTSKEISDRILAFIMDNYNFPYEIWRLFDSYFSWITKKDRLYNDFPTNFIDFIVYKINTKNIFRYEELKECKEDKQDLFITEYNRIYSALDDYDLYTAKVSIEAAKEICPNHPDLLILIARNLVAKGGLKEGERLFTDIINNNKDDLDAYFYRGDLYFRMGKIEEAYNDYKMALDIKPDSQGILYALGKTCIILEKYEEAIKLFEKLQEYTPYNSDIRIILNSAYNFYIDKLLEYMEQNPMDKQLKYKLAEAYFKTSRTEDSYNILNELMQDTNFTSEMYCLFCQVLMTLNNKELAYTTVCKALDLFDEDHKLNFLKADLLEEFGKHEEALLQYDKIISFNKDDSTAYNNKAYLLNMLGRYNEALECANMAIEIDPNIAHGYKNKAIALLELEFYEDCLNACEQALNIFPYLTEVYVIKMRAFIDINLYDEALRVYNTASDFGLTDSKLYYEKARVLRMLERFEESINFCDLAIELDENNVDCYYSKGLCYYFKEDYDEAIECFNIAIDHDINHGGAYYYKVNSLMHLSREEEALDILDEVFNSDVPHLDSFYNLKGSIMRYLKNYEEAVIQYRKAISYDPNIAKYYYLLGYSLNELERFDEAIEPLEKAIELDSNEIDWHVDISHSLYKIDEFERCIEYCNRAIEIDEEYDIPHQNKGWAYYRLGKIDEAEEACSIALKLNGNNYNALLLKLRILQDKSLYEDALIMCHRLLEINKNDEEVKEVKEEILKQIRTDKKEKKGLFKSLFK